MKRKGLLLAEIIGVFAVAAGVFFLWNVYELTGKSTLGVVFGAVNFSVWEKIKCVSISYFVFGLVELLCLKPEFRAFVVSKTAGLCMADVVFMIADCAFDSDIILLLASLLFGFLCSFILYSLRLAPRPLFAPSCFMLMLIFVMIISFTVFPPRLSVFRDPVTGCYGVVSEGFDMGAVELTSKNFAILS